MYEVYVVDVNMCVVHMVKHSILYPLDTRHFWCIVTNRLTQMKGQVFVPSFENLLL